MTFSRLRDTIAPEPLFHLLVPGGKWQTAMRKPVSSASFCSSHLHNRRREPLLPPESAVVSRRLARGEGCWAMEPHHRRMLWTANSAGAWAPPTLAQAALRPLSEMPDGRAR